MSYTVSKGSSSRARVSFTCAACATPLESPITEAGQKFPCPNCGKQFTTPGVDELEKLIAEEAEDATRQAEAEKARIKAKAKAEFEAKMLAQAREEDRLKAEREKLEYERQEGLGRRVPSYDGITFGAGLLFVFSVLTWVGSFIACVAMVNMQNESAGLLILAYGVVAGGLLWMFGSVGIAIRDIARNSFRR